MNYARNSGWKLLRSSLGHAVQKWLMSHSSSEPNRRLTNLLANLKPACAYVVTNRQQKGKYNLDIWVAIANCRGTRLLLASTADKNSVSFNMTSKVHLYSPLSRMIPTPGYLLNGQNGCQSSKNTLELT